MQEWKTDIKDWTKISEKTATLMLNQCETALKETLDTAKSISVRADRFISIILPIMSVLIIYVINNINVWCEILPLSAISAVLLLILALAYCIPNFWKYEICIPGEYPKNIVVSQFIDNDFDHNQQYLNMVLSICENIQIRIDINDKNNEIRTKRNKRCLITLLCLPLSIPFGMLLEHIYAFLLPHF